MIEIKPYIIKMIEFLPYDPALPNVAKKVMELIRSRIPDAQFEHIGSTAIRHMPGKNAINLQLLSLHNQYHKRVEILTQLGFVPSPSPLIGSDEPVYVALVRYENSDYAVHVLLTPPNSAYHLNAVYFRDYLIAHPDLASEYAEIKKEAVANGKTDPVSYNKAKEPFIQSILYNKPLEP